MLPTGLAQQALFSLRYALLGLALAVLYDVLRAVRTRFRLKKWGTAALDLLFCLVLLVSFLLLQLRGTDGRLRFYLVLGLAAGFFLWRKTLSAPFLRLLLKLMGLVGQAFAGVRRFLLWAFSFPRGN